MQTAPCLLALTLFLPLDAGAQDARIFAPGKVSTEAAVEYGPAFTPTGDTVYFTRRASLREPPRLWWSVRIGTGEWAESRAVAFSTGEGDEYPSVSPDGRRLYFASRRPLRSGDTRAPENRLWVATLGAGGWGRPAPVRIGGREAEFGSHPVEASDGSLYFHGRRPGGTGRVDAYHADRDGNGFGEPQLLPINSPAVDGEVVLFPSADRMVFYSDRTGGLGLGDLYYSVRGPAGWSEPRNLGGTVNTAEYEWTPSLSADGRMLYFARMNAAFDRGDILMIETGLVPGLAPGRTP